MQSHGSSTSNSKRAEILTCQVGFIPITRAWGVRTRFRCIPTIVLLRPAAEGPELNGAYERRYRNGDVYDWFRYDVVRIWQLPVGEFAGLGLPVLPLAAVADVQPEDVPGVLLEISQRLMRGLPLNRRRRCGRRQRSYWDCGIRKSRSKIFHGGYPP